MRVLLLTFYFEPDLCAGSFRNTAFVNELKSYLDTDKDQLDIVTTMPNRYATYEAEANENEKLDENIEVFRIPLPEHKSGFSDQINSFRVYYREAQRIISKRSYDLVIASSSRLFTAFLGARISRNKDAKLYLDMRDLFRENMQEIITNPFVNKPLATFLKIIEAYTFKSADRINIVSEGFRPFFETFGKPISFFPNGIDDVFLENNFSKPVEGDDRMIITYAGNIGDGQGLHKIIPDTARQLSDTNYHFRIIGDGGIRKELEDVIVKNDIKNVELIDPVERNELLRYYKETDYLFLHLNDYEAFKKVLPSKIFEYAATGKPMIAGVGGYARKFLEEYVEGVLLFDPCDVESLVNQLKEGVLSPDVVDRKSFIDKFARSNIMNEMAGKIYHQYKPVI